MSSFKKILIAIDQFINTILGGYPDETLSARSYRNEQKGSKKWKVVRIIIDVIFFWEKYHCEESYYSEFYRNHLPKEYRKKK